MISNASGVRRLLVHHAGCERCRPAKRRSVKIFRPLRRGALPLMWYTLVSAYCCRGRAPHAFLLRLCQTSCSVSCKVSPEGLEEDGVLLAIDYRQWTIVHCQLAWCPEHGANLIEQIEENASILHVSHSLSVLQGVPTGV
jgi:hypothetical protein